MFRPFKFIKTTIILIHLLVAIILIGLLVSYLFFPKDETKMFIYNRVNREYGISLNLEDAEIEMYWDCLSIDYAYYTVFNLSEDYCARLSESLSDPSWTRALESKEMIELCVNQRFKEGDPVSGMLEICREPDTYIKVVDLIHTQYKLRYSIICINLRLQKLCYYTMTT